MHKYLFKVTVTCHFTSQVKPQEEKYLIKKYIYILVSFLCTLEKGEKRDFVKRNNDHNAKCIIRVSILKIFFV